ncbi:hypothetical protein BH11ACT1_BH11ACT1_26320 [soil metagenome]
MPHAAVARLLTAGLASIALLAPVWVLAPASAVSAFSSCSDIQQAQPTAPDGTYEITDFNQTVTVWCADMATTPIEYLTLPHSGGAYNFSQDTYTVQVTTHYTRVRLNLPSTAGGSFSIDPTDDRFATSDGAPQRTWGWTSSCFNLPNDANLDLTGTPFGMSTNNLAYSGFGTVTISPDTQVIDIRGAGGWCGGIHAVNPFPLSWLYTAPSVTTSPTDQTAASGTDATFTASGTGTPTPTVSWQSSPDGATWTDIAGATSGTLTVQSVTYALSGTLYRALVSSDQGTAPTAAAQLTVTPIAPTVSNPSGTTVVSGNDATFGVTVTGDPTPTIQWQRSVGGSWSDIAGATATTLVLTGVTTHDDGALVRAVVNSIAGTDTSASAKLSVDPSAPTVTDPGSVSASSGHDATFSVGVTGDPTPTVQWQTSTDGVQWTDIVGATRPDLVLGGVTTAQDGSAYRAVVTNAGGTATSKVATLSVTAAAPVLTTAPVGRSVTAGQAAVFTVVATGDPAPAYQWQTSVDNVVWSDVAGATSVTLTLSAVTAAQNGLWVRVYVANAGGAASSDGVQLTVASSALRAALAVTGGSPFGMLALAGSLLGAGACTTVLARRRRSVV